MQYILSEKEYNSLTVKPFIKLTHKNGEAFVTQKPLRPVVIDGAVYLTFASDEDIQPGWNAFALSNIAEISIY